VQQDLADDGDQREDPHRDGDAEEASVEDRPVEPRRPKSSEIVPPSAR
jgi:hypothetical protein